MRIGNEAIQETESKAETTQILVPVARTHEAAPKCRAAVEHKRVCVVEFEFADELLASR